MKKIPFLLVLVSGFALAALGIILITAALTPAEAANTFPPTHTPQPTVAQAMLTTPTPPQLNTVEVVLPAQKAQTITLPEDTLTDEQGAIIVEITPLNASEARNTLNFDVSLNTHSVDLSMDLAALATLTTDNGLKIQAILWDAPRGGHHVEGNLSFPALPEDMAMLAEATKVTLTILNVDAPERVFTWDLRN